MRDIFIKIGSKIIDAIFPIECISCGDEAIYLCGKCMLDVDPVGIPALKPGNNLKMVIVGYRYSNRMVMKLIHDLKYRNYKATESAVYNLINKWAIKYGCIFPKNSVIVPVPLHKNKYTERGFNQADIISVALGEVLGLRVEGNYLVRHRSTKPQSKLVSGKVKNVRDAFKASSSLVEKHKNVIIVDDILTSGATMRECAKILGSAGCENIYGFALAGSFTNRLR